LYTQNLLHYANILQARREGLKYYIEGGGVATEQDSLFEFKAGFSKLTKDFYVYKRIPIKEEYDRLTKLRGDDEGTHDDFFPKYRIADFAIT
jgi:hypothetical protein